MRRTISKHVRQEVYEKYNGHCAYCGCEIEYKDMQVDHIVSVFANEYYEMGDKKPKHEILSNNELNSIENYMPACRQCNFLQEYIRFRNIQKAFNRSNDEKSSKRI